MQTGKVCAIHSHTHLFISLAQAAFFTQSAKFQLSLRDSTPRGERHEEAAAALSHTNCPVGMCFILQSNQRFPSSSSFFFFLLCPMFFFREHVLGEILEAAN